MRLRNSIVTGDSGEDDCSGRLDQNRGNLIADWSCRAPLGREPAARRLYRCARFSSAWRWQPGPGCRRPPKFCLEADQTGTPRAQGDGCDIGAIQSTSATPSTTPIKSICNLSFQIIAANQDRWIGACPPGSGADTIELTEDVTLTEPLPRITSDIAIEGNGYTISGDKRFRIFDVERGNFTLRDLTLADGNAQGEGGRSHLAGTLGNTQRHECNFL